MADLYALLGVGSRADAGEIKVAFRRLAKTMHPDLNPGDSRANRRFRDINRAYATLRDPTARARYDRQCVHERARARRAWRGAVLTMSACFVMTVISGLVVAWVQVEARNRTSDAPPHLARALPLSLGVSD
jgi:DnaJ domain